MADPDVRAGSEPADAPARRRSLILAGGGMKVGYQAGVLQVLLDEAKLGFAHADGTSGGCLNLAMVQSGLTGTKIANNWRTTGPFDLTSFRPLHRYLAPWRLPSILTFDRLLRQLTTWGVDFARIRTSPIEGTYNVFDFTHKVLETHTEVDLTPELFTACFALPIWFPAVRTNGKTYIDGVYWKDANLTEAVRRGADEIWVIWTVAEEADVHAGPYRQYFDIIEAVAVGRFYEELAEIERINEAVRARTDTDHREIRVHVIRHPTPVPLDYLLFFSAGDMSRIVDMGVRDARAYLAASGVPFDPSGPLAPPIGLRFIEQMRGSWTPGEADPRAGERAGLAAGRRLGVRLTISIEDMDAFLGDPTRLAHATGTIDCPELGGRLPIGDGRFNVLAETGRRDRRMRYELPFAASDGEAFLMVGEKEVADDAGADAWSDTTTLYARIHRGTSSDGEIVGAGVLYLRLGDLARQMTTFRILRSRDAVTLVLTLLGFSRFFVGALWRTFVLRR
jgi:predicted patatin/cPLA2 family phospholipase